MITKKKKVYMAPNLAIFPSTLGRPISTSESQVTLTRGGRDDEGSSGGGMNWGEVKTNPVEWDE